MNQAASRVRSEQLVAGWNSLDYTSLQGELSWLTSERVVWPDHTLSEKQLATLKSRVRQSLDYLRGPSLEHYHALKTAGLTWRFQISPQVANEYRSALGAASEPGEVVARLWEATAPAGTADERSRLVSINLGHFVAAASRTNSRGAIVNGPVAKGLTMLRVAPEPGFMYEPSQAPANLNGPDQLYVHVSFYARSNTSTNAGPVYISFAWSETDQQWAADRLMSDVALKLEVLF